MPGTIHIVANSDCTACGAKACQCGSPHQAHAHDVHAAPVRSQSCAPHHPGSHHPTPQMYYPAPAQPHTPSAPYNYNQATPYHCQPHACGPHAACDPAPCGPAHAHTHPAGNCHDVSLLLGHLKALAMPAITYSCAPHPPLSVCLPTDVGRTPHAFAFEPRLIRDELHHPLLCYLAEGVSPGVLTTGLAGTKVQTAHRLLAAERPDGYRALQCLVYGHILLSINVLLLEESARNSCIDARRLWTVTSPCAASASNASSLELRIGGLAGVALEVHPTTVVSNSLMDAVINAVKSGSVFDATRGRVVADPTGDPILHVDALALLTQVRSHATATEASFPSLPPPLPPLPPAPYQPTP